MKKRLAWLTAAILALSSIPAFTVSGASPTLTVYMTEKTGEMRHGSAGFLYGLGSDGTPNANMLTPLKPAAAVQKAPDGLQHPTGDVLDVAETFIEAGGEQIQIYLQDIYALWSYEYTGIDDYLARIEEMVPKIVALRESNSNFEGKFVYIPYNEPDGIWFTDVDTDSSVQETFNEYWQRAYELIRSLDPQALIGGVSYATYRSNAMESWIKFCVENNCQPDYITWHELQTDKLSSFKSHLDHYRSLEEKYGMEEREIIINEYAPQGDCSVPGKLVNWIALFEENKVSGCLPYWHNAGNLNDIAADNNQPNGAWWLYKWYGDMSGETLEVETSTSRDQLYGLASIDDNKGISNVLFGGIDGYGDIVLKDIDQTAAFDGAAAVDIKVEATYWTAYHGVAPEPDVILSGTYPVENGSVTIAMSGMEEYAAYNITVTRAADESLAGIVFKGAWRQTYEAEDASLVGTAYKNSSNSQGGTFTYSGGYRVSGMDSSGGGVDITVDVPQSGYYRADMIYGNGVGLNTSDPDQNNPITVTQTRTIDSGEAETLVLENTLKWAMAGMYTDYIYLSAGEHMISLRGTDATSQGASVDCLSLTYSGMEIPDFDSIYEAELGDFNTLLDNKTTAIATENETEGYSGSGYITGLEKKSVEEGGGVRFTVVVPDNALYNLTLCYSAETDGEGEIYLDNTALTTTNKLLSLALPKTEGFDTASATVFLQTGINIIDIDTDGAALDYLRVRKALNAEDETITVQAEDAVLSGNAQILENSYSDGGKYVANIEGATDDGLEITVNASEAGEYKMVITHSNSELFGAHDYNAQIVDRYASYKVNDAEAVRLYFKNTYSDENWRTVAVPVTLESGENTIKFYNDNWRILENGTLKSGTTEHIPENIEYHTLTNYAPNFDSFSFTPAFLASAAEVDERCKITVSATEGGIVSVDKNSAAVGDTVTLTFESTITDASVKVLANGEDVSSLIENNSLAYTVSINTEFKVIFISPENSDEYISNNSFGTGDFSGWSVEGNAQVALDGDEHYALISGGCVSQEISLQNGYYTLSFKAQGEDLSVEFGDKTLYYDSISSTITLRAAALDSNISLKVSSGGDLSVDDFEIIDFAPIDETLLYFVDCGDSDPQTLSQGDELGIYNSVTEQFFSADPVTGAEWGIADEYSLSTSYPSLLTGKDTWPYEYDTSDGRDKIVSFRYAKDQDDSTGAGVTYKFSLDDAAYTFEVGFYQPSAWSSVNRKASLSVNGEVIAQGVLPLTDSSNPIIVKAAANVEGGFATLNLKLDSDGVGGPMMSYIKIALAGEAVEGTKIDTAGMEITGSETWNNVSSTAAKYAFDGDEDTYFDGVSGGYAQIDLGSEIQIAKIGFVPRSSWSSRMQGSVFYASKDGESWTKLFVIPSVPSEGTETAVESNCFLTDDCSWRYLKYQNPYDYCNVAEINIYETVKTGGFENLLPEVFRILSLSDTLKYKSEVDAMLIYADYASDGSLEAVAMEVLAAGEGETDFESGHDKTFVWVLEKAIPLVVFNDD